MQSLAVAALLLSTLDPSLSVADRAMPACTRVLPGVEFARRSLIEPETLLLSARVGRNGEGGLLLVRRLPGAAPGDWRFPLQLATADGHGSLAFGPPTDLEPFVPRWTPASVLAGDLDGDGLTDAVVFWAWYWSEAIGALDFYRGGRDGAFAFVSRYPLESTIAGAGPALGDFDADGRADVVLLAPMCSGCGERGLHLLGIDGDGNWTVRREVPVGEALEHPPVVVDWDENGIDDVVFLASTNVYFSRIGVSLGDTSSPFGYFGRGVLFYPIAQLLAMDRRLVAVEGTKWWWFSTYTAVHQPRPGPGDILDAWSIPLDGESAGLHGTLDVDGDGRQDLLLGRIASSWGGRLGCEIWWGEAEGPPAQGPSTADPNPPMASLDLNGDGVRDLIAHGLLPLVQSTPRVLDEGLFASTVSHGWNDEPYAYLDIGDVNEDGLDDVVAQTWYAESFTMNLSRGDGTFDVHPVGLATWELGLPALRDLDGDGHLDLATFFRVGWGRGDGTFGPWDVRTPDTGVSGGFGDLDRDGDADVVEFQREYGTPAIRTLRTYFGANRAWEATGFVERRDETGYDPFWVVADLDGDRRDDLVVVRNSYDGPRSAALTWRRSPGDGTLAPEERLLDFDFEGSLARVTPTDFDQDGMIDLFVASYSGSSLLDANYWSLRNTGGGRFEIAWTGVATPWYYGMTEELAEVDGDGRPDLVYGQFDPYSGPTYYLKVRRGDGFGGFLPAKPATWIGPVGRPGRFRRTGTRDLVRLHQYDAFRINLELFPSAGQVLPEDVDPPTVDLRLAPVVDTTSVPARFDGTWRVLTSPIDDCDSHPRVTARRIALLPVDAAAPVTYRPSARSEAAIYEVPADGRREVLLLGPDEAAARRAFDDARRAGGFGFGRLATLNLASTATFGAERGPALPGSRMAQRFVLENGSLVGAAHSRPGSGLEIALDAEDRAGHRGTTRIPFEQARAEALARACADPAIARHVCR